MTLSYPQTFIKRCLLTLLALGILLVSVQGKSQSNTYKLGAGDMIGISVFREADLSLQVRLGDTGAINYPFIGEIPVAGKSPAEVETLIEQLLISGEFLVSPDVSVNILQYRPFYIDGEVANPGSYPFEPGLTLRKAISIAGGFTERASRSNITILSETDQIAQEVANFLDTPIHPDDIITIDSRFF